MAPATVIGGIRRRESRRSENRAANVATGWEYRVGVTPVSRATTTPTQRWVGPLSYRCWVLRLSTEKTRNGRRRNCDSRRFIFYGYNKRERGGENIKKKDYKK